MKIYSKMLINTIQGNKEKRPNWHHFDVKARDSAHKPELISFLGKFLERRKMEVSRVDQLEIFGMKNKS